jgi:hypothetical protein
MNDRFFKNKITLYHFEGDNVVIKHFEKVYFRHDNKDIAISKGEKRGSTGTITIPTTETLNIGLEDYVIEGIINDEFDYKTLLSTYKVYKVIYINDNRKGNLQHYKIGVSE